MKKWLGSTMVLGLALLLSGVAMAGDSTTVAVSANVVGTCKFLTGGTMAFGDLDPSSGADKSAIVAQPTFWCTKNAGYAITDDKGLNESGNIFRVKHATLNEYIPYTFTYTANGTGGGRTSTLTMNISGTIAFADYRDASAGGFSDTVTLTINP